LTSSARPDATPPSRSPSTIQVRTNFLLLSACTFICTFILLAAVTAISNHVFSIAKYTGAQRLRHHIDPHHRNGHGQHVFALHSFSSQAHHQTISFLSYRRLLRGLPNTVPNPIPSRIDAEHSHPHLHRRTPHSTTLQRRSPDPPTWCFWLRGLQFQLGYIWNISSGGPAILPFECHRCHHPSPS